jgi:16S rRNA processing protein RimM
MKNKIPIAKIGKTYGVKGWLKIHFLTDFPEQFKVGKIFKTDKETLTIENINHKNNTIKFKRFNNPEEAKKLTNRTIYSDIESSHRDIKLKKDEYFWFDIIGCKVYEKNKLLGIIEDINRINDINYIVVKVDKSMQKNGKPKRFLFDFKRHIIEVDIKNKKLIVENTIPILEAS